MFVLVVIFKYNQKKQPILLVIEKPEQFKYITQVLLILIGVLVILIVGLLFINSKLFYQFVIF